MSNKQVLHTSLQLFEQDTYLKIFKLTWLTKYSQTNYLISGSDNMDKVIYNWASILSNGLKLNDII